jgi:hypothetical protein
LPGAFEYWAPDAGQIAYTSILIDPIQLHFASERGGDTPSAERLMPLRRFVDDEIRAAIARHHPIADRSGPGVARLRLQVSNVRPLKQLPPTRSYTHLPRYRLGSANIEAELADSESGKTIVAWVGLRRSAGEAERFSRPADWTAIKTQTAESIHTVVDRVFAKLRASWNRRRTEASRDE